MLELYAQKLHASKSQHIYYTQNFEELKKFSQKFKEENKIGKLQWNAQIWKRKAKLQWKEQNHMHNWKNLQAYDPC